MALEEDSLLSDEKLFLQRKTALENEIQKRLVEQLAIRTQTRSTSPEQQSLIEELYLDLKFINPELALNTLKAYASLRNAGIKLKLNNDQKSESQQNTSTDISMVKTVETQNTIINNYCKTKKEQTMPSFINGEASKTIIKNSNSSIRIKQVKSKDLNNIADKKEDEKSESDDGTSSKQLDVKRSTSTSCRTDLSPSTVLKKLETEIQKRLCNQLELVKNQNKPITQEQMTHIEQLYNDLELVNPDLAFQTLQLVKQNRNKINRDNENNKNNNNDSTLTNNNQKNYITHVKHCCSISKRHTISRPSSITNKNNKNEYCDLKFKSTSKIR